MIPYSKNMHTQMLNYNTFECAYLFNPLAVISLIEKPKHVYIALNADTLSGEEDSNVPFDSETKQELIKRNTDLLNNYVQLEGMLKEAHDASWKEFWNRSDIKIPNDRLQHAYYLEMYKIFANERKGSWPVTLHGVWNNDTRMPAWYGDWHNDLNVQACYWPAFKTNNIELAESYIDYYTKAIPRLSERATPLKTTNKGYPLFPDEDVFESHRLFCQLYPIFPLGTDTHSKTAELSLNAVVDMGFMEYAAWSFPYLAIFASRCGRGNMARSALEIYCMAFRARNSFVVNGDPNQNGILKISDTNAGESSDAFTLEAGFMVAAALSEMFVHRSKDTVYIAYGIPDEWNSCSCSNMTIEGGHKVSVVMEKYSIRNVTIHANCDETVQFSFAKLLGGLTLNREKFPAQEKYSVTLTKGKTEVFEVCHE